GSRPRTGRACSASFRASPTRCPRRSAGPASGCTSPGRLLNSTAARSRSSHSRAPGPPSRCHCRGSRVGTRILVVQDDPSLRKIYVTMLTKVGFDVAGAFDGEDALRVAAEREPELILLDMMMPRMTGIEFLRAYDVPGKHPTVKVIAFSNTEKLEFVDD